MASINFYERFAIEHLVLSTDDNGLYCEVISENQEDVSYRVNVNEETMQATTCNCLGHRRWGHCKHANLVNKAFAGYKAAPVVTEVEAGNWYIVNKNTQVWMNDGQWIAVGETANAIEIVKVHLAKQDAVAEAMKIVAAPDEIIPGVNRIKGTLHVKGDPIIRAPKVTDISNKGNFGSKAFSLLR